MWQSILFYFVSISLSSLLIFCGRKFKRGGLFTVLGLLLLIFIGAIRFGIGADYKNYLVIYQHFAIGGFPGDMYLLSIEPVFQWLAQISYIISGTPILYFAIPWALTVILSFVGLRKIGASLSHKRFAIAWTAITLLLIMFGFDQIRQTLAIAVFFSSFKYIVDKKLVKYLALTIFATMCHTSAIIIMLPAYFLVQTLLRARSGDIGRKGKQIVRIGAAGAVLFIFALDFFRDILLSINVKYITEAYRLLDGDGGDGKAKLFGIISFGVEELVVLALFAVAFISMRRANHQAEKDKALNTLFLLVSLGFALSFLSLFITFGGRLAQYFILFIPVAIAMCNISSRYARGWFLSVSLFILMVVTGWHGVFPYHSIFEPNADIDAIRNQKSPYITLLCDTGIKKDCSAFEITKEIDIGGGTLWSPQEVRP